MGRVVDTQRLLRSLGLASLPAPVMRGLENMLGVAAFERVCARAGVSAANADVRRQIADAFAAAGIRWTVTEAERSVDLRRAGPLIFYTITPTASPTR